MTSNGIGPANGAHSTGFLAVILGPDGAGKTTLSRELRTLAADWHFASLQPEDLYPLDEIPEYNLWALSTHPREYVAHMRPLTRVSFFTHVLSMAWEYRMRPHLEAGGVVVSDSYWYRATVKESVHNPEAAFLLEKLAATMPDPHLVIWLDMPLTESWRRNGSPTVFEIEGAVPSWEAYASFQRRVIDEVRRLLPTHIPQVTVDATCPPYEVAQAVYAAINTAAAGVRPPRLDEDVI
ncbi:hypothetical protein OG417_37200 [Actinoallomurus sp. NBC_01490]|uniref:dTMP kinase n=1 Tax=Actinoallomurus sp. NBC_01490 TaxID=2903557 RepID=UPI002E318F20|nr:hypothetical protein [Actinoallomurus sp. NBC_01490]